MIERSVVVDTNVLVYALDRSDSGKQRRAVEVLAFLEHRGMGALSTQILAEFFTAVSRRIAEPLTAEIACERTEDLIRSWTVLPVTSLVVLEALRGVREYQFNYWDAQVWAVARLNQVPTVLSEDFNAGAAIEGVRFVNPFEPSFRVAELVS